MSIWGAVKNALNSTIGTSKAKALNDIIDDRLYINLIEKDVVDSEINNILNNSAKTINSVTATLIGTYVATHDYNLTINVTGYNANVSSSYPSYIGYSVDREVTTTTRADFYGSDGVDEYATIVGMDAATVSFNLSVKEGQTVRIYAISYSTSTSYTFNYSNVEVISRTFRTITTLEKYGIKSVQRGTINGIEKTTNYTISSVTPSKCLVVINGAGASRTGTNSSGYTYYSTYPYVSSLSDTELIITISGYGYANGSWEVIEFY